MSGKTPPSRRAVVAIPLFSTDGDAPRGPVKPCADMNPIGPIATTGFSRSSRSCGRLSSRTLGEAAMMAVVIAGLALAGLGLAGVWVGVRVSRILRERFDELMPQRMVDYSGFVPTNPLRD
jgi:hypothetical protein